MIDYIDIYAHERMDEPFSIFFFSAHTRRMLLAMFSSFLFSKPPKKNIIFYLKLNDDLSLYARKNSILCQNSFFSSSFMN